MQDRFLQRFLYQDLGTRILVPGSFVVNLIVNLVVNFLMNLIMNLIVNLVVAKDLVSRDIRLSEPRHWMVFG